MKIQIIMENEFFYVIYAAVIAIKHVYHFFEKIELLIFSSTRKNCGNFEENYSFPRKSFFRYEKISTFISIKAPCQNLMKTFKVLSLIGRWASVKILAPNLQNLLVKFTRKISPINLTFIAIKNVSTNIHVFMLIKVRLSLNIRGFMPIKVYENL
jgi:hypothetical protein